MSQNKLISSEISALKNELICSICLNLFNEPVTLKSCRHTFCLECFKKLFSNSRLTVCPICKKLINRRLYYLNEQFVATIEFLKMSDIIIISDKNGSDEDDIYDRNRRMKNFLDDCMIYKGNVEECISLSSSFDSDTNSVSKLDAFEITKKNAYPKVSKTPMPKTKSLNCNKTKSKYPQKKSKGTDQVVNDTIQIDECDSPDLRELGEEESKIVKLLEDECLRNFENELENDEQNKNKLLDNNEKDKKKTQKQRKNSKNSKTCNSTGWSRMKTMKKQINKKEIKYKQLNVSTDVNKCKLKSPQDKIVKQFNLKKELTVLLEDISDNNLNKTEVTKTANTIVSIKRDNVSNENLDDVFTMCTQKLKTPVVSQQQHNIDIIHMNNVENDKENTSLEFIVDVQVHRTSTPVKIVSNKEEIIVEKIGSKQSMNENICDIRKEIPKRACRSKVNKSNKNETLNDKKSSEETDYIISATERTPESTKRVSTRAKRNINKRNFNESKQSKNTPQKRRKIIEQNKEDESVDGILKGKIVSTIENKNQATLIDKEKSDETFDKIRSVDSAITEQNVVKQQDFVKNELKMFYEQKPAVIAAVQRSINTVNIILSQCSNYVKSESLFSESWPSKNSKKSNSAATLDQPRVLLDCFQSLPLQTNSLSSVNFYNTAIPCLKKIEVFYNQIFSLSQQLTEEMKKFGNTFNTGEEMENVFVSLKQGKSTENVEIQTDNIICPKCSFVFNFKAADEIKLLKEIEVTNGFNKINDIDSITKLFTNDIDSQKNKSGNSKKVNSNLSSVQHSVKSSASDIIKSKKINRQLTYSEDSNKSQISRKFKRIRSPTPDTDSESVRSKKSNSNYSKFLYRDDIDIFFQSEHSEKNLDLSLSSQTKDKYTKKLFKSYEKILTNPIEEEDTAINPEDATTKYVSILEREYKDAQFDNISKPEESVEKQTFDSAPNTVLDNLLRSINLSTFENDNFETNDIKAKQQKDDLIKKRATNNIPDVLSASMFSQPENELYKLSDINKTTSIEKLNVTESMVPQNAEEKELDKEVENLTGHNLIEESLGSDKDLFEDNIVENTPQKIVESRRERSKYEHAEQLQAPILNIIEPPLTVTENLDWIDIAPPPPLEFRDSEKVEDAKLNIPNVSSITPDIFTSNSLDKGFFANSSILSGNAINQIEHSQKNFKKESVELENLIPDSNSPKNIIKKDDENTTPKNKSGTESSVWRSSKRNLNPIVLAQREKFSPLQIIVNTNTSPKPVISSTTKQQKSILSYMQTSQKENVNEITKTNTPVKQNVHNVSNTFKPVKENLQIEVCESPVPQNIIPSTSFAKNFSFIDKSKKNVVIAFTRLTREESITIINLTQKLHAKYCRDFDNKVTHLVVSVDDRNWLKDHTIKYILGIAHSVWIVSFAWIRDSMQQNRILPEEPYEVLDVSGIPGPKKSRLTRLTNPLFKHFQFCLVDPFTSVDKSDFEKAITGLGGEIKTSLKDLLSQTDKYRLILVQAKDTQDFDHYEVWTDTYKVLVVDIEWLSRTIGQYELISVRPYICYDKDINDMGYPFALIAPVPETLSEMTCTNR